MSSSDRYTDQESMKEVVEQSASIRWQRFPEPETWVYKADRDFSIELLNPNSRQEREWEQPEWASAFPNDTTHENTVRLKYRGAPFDQKHVYQLDEFRATVVVPNRDYESAEDESDPFDPNSNHDSAEDEPDLYLTPYEAQVSFILSGGHFEDYLPALDVEIKEEPSEDSSF